MDTTNTQKLNKEVQAVVNNRNLQYQYSLERRIRSCAKEATACGWREEIKAHYFALCDLVEVLEACEEAGDFAGTWGQDEAERIAAELNWNGKEYGDTTNYLEVLKTPRKFYLKGGRI